MKTFNKMRNEKGEMRNCFFSGAILVLSAFCFLLSAFLLLTGRSL